MGGNAIEIVYASGSAAKNVQQKSGRAAYMRTANVIQKHLSA
jgi:hypothetical protein